jgi:hypothetical protein
MKFPQSELTDILVTERISYLFLLSSRCVKLHQLWLIFMSDLKLQLVKCTRGKPLCFTRSDIRHHIYIYIYIEPCWRYLLGLQTTPLNYSQAFIADFTRRYYNRSVTNSSLANCVDHSLFLSTLLTVDYFRWRPNIHCRLSALVVSSLANYGLAAD